MDLIGWAIFLFALLFSVMLHESGHFIAAKRFGMKCTRYFVGFGPTIWSTRRGETEYGIKAIPLGGFVKIVGMTSLDEVEPEDEARSFRRAPAWQRVIVLVAGSFMHFVLAFLLIFGLAMAVGVENDNTTSLGTVSACVPASNKALNDGTPCTAKDARSPSSLAGLKVNDQVTSFDGTKVTSWNQLAEVIKRTPPGTDATIVVLRHGHPVTLHAKLAGIKGRSGGYLGVAANIVFQPSGPIGAVGYAGTGFSQEITGSADAVAALPGEIPKLFAKPASKGSGGVISVVGAAEATGQAVADNIGWQYKVSFVLLLIASLNIFVGALNLLPLHPMDGGHVAVVIYESIRSRIARWRGRPDPGLADIRKLIPVSFSIFMVIGFFSLLVMVANIWHPVNIG